MHENLKDFNSIKGFLDHEEGILLYQMAKKYCIKTFAVEIGSYCGKSACYIGEACKENRTHLVTIDHHRGSEEQQYGEEYFDGGILTIHDIYDSELEGGQAPREIYKKALEENFKLVKRVKSLVALEKIS
ncbi:MAG: class I SAM-dependent methyltransferase [Proteobacteria bacterium]|nr:class I SAM-dependent methyltransferase [Pseudomonadota bacterium]